MNRKFYMTGFVGCRGMYQGFHGWDMNDKQPGSLQFFQIFLQLTRNPCRIAGLWKANWRAYLHIDGIWPGKSLSGLLQFKQSVDAHGNDWYPEIIC